jgi:hypothetical protein
LLGANRDAGWEDERFGDGERGDFGDELGDLATMRNLDGDRDRERLSDRTADVTSTWCACVGEGNVRVPPPCEYDMAAVEEGETRLRVRGASRGRSMFRVA